MPFVSQAQRGYMYANHPKIAKEFESKTPAGKKLPYHVKGSSSHQLKAMKSIVSKSKSSKPKSSKPKERSPGGYYGTKNYDPSKWD